MTILGQRLKPVDCFQSCPLAYQNQGFCSDSIHKETKVVLVQAGPGKSDIAAREAGNSGMATWCKAVLTKGIFSDEEIGWVSFVRCLGAYPTGPNKKAEVVCRRYDNHVLLPGGGSDGVELTRGGLVDWNPDIFFVTFDLKAARKLAAMEYLVRETLAKVRKFVDSGYRPVILLGKETFSFFRPELSGHKNWYGHWWEGKWEDPGIKGNLIQTFKPVKTLVSGRKKERAPVIGEQLSLF